MTVSVSIRYFTFAALLLAGVGTASASDAYVSASVGGVLAPGVYGRIDIGNAPPPPVLYAQPVIIARPAVVVPQQALYLYVPPGHAKNWRKHCARYNACGQPVYFVNADNRGRYIYPDRRGDHRDDGRRGGHDNDHRGDGHGKGHGKGHGHRD